MRRILLLSLLLLSAVLPVVGSPEPARAGSGSSTSCNDGAGNYTPWVWEVAVITSPITLAVHVITQGDYYLEPKLRLCYSTSPAGYTGPDVTGGSIDIEPYNPTTYGSPPDDTYVRCTDQSNQDVLTVPCYVGTSPWYTYSPTDNTYRFGIPVTLCHISCTTLNPSVGRTGVLVGSFSGSRPTGTDEGAGVKVPTLAFCANGTCQSLPATPVGVGWSLDQVVASCTYGCPWPDVTVGVKNDQPIAAVQVGATVVPVTSPVEQCVRTVALPSVAVPYAVPCP